jgi:hypothetical protein
MPLLIASHILEHEKTIAASILACRTSGKHWRSVR